MEYGRTRYQVNPNCPTRSIFGSAIAGHSSPIPGRRFPHRFYQETDRPVLLHKRLPTAPTGRSALRFMVPTENIRDPKASAFKMIIDDFCHAQFFAAPRTRDQLGYTVASLGTQMHMQNYVSFVVETEKLNGTSMLQQFGEWIQYRLIAGIVEKDYYLEIDGEKPTTTPFAKHFDGIKNSVVAKLDPSLETKTGEQETLLIWYRENLAICEQTLISRVEEHDARGLPR